MRIIYALQSKNAGPGQFWMGVIKLASLILTVIVLLAVALIGLFVLLPLMLIGGIALSFYLRRRLRQARREQPRDGVIDAEYTVIDRH